MEKKYLFVVVCFLLTINLFSNCGAETVTSNEAETLNETPECKANDTECQNGLKTIVEEPMSNLVEEEEVTLETTTEYGNITDETTTENLTLNVYYASIGNETDSENVTDVTINDKENTTLIDEYLFDDNATEVISIIPATEDELDIEFTTENSTDDSVFLVNATEYEEAATTIATVERDTTLNENISDTTELVAANISVTTTEPEITATEAPEEIFNTSSATNSSSTPNITTSDSTVSTSNTTTAENASSSIVSSSMTSSTAEATSEDVDSLNAASHTSTEDDENKLKLFIPIGVVGILVLVGFVAYFLVRKMKKTATYECEPYS